MGLNSPLPISTEPAKYLANPHSFEGNMEKVGSYVEPLFLWRPEYDKDYNLLSKAVLQICAMLDASCYFHQRWGKRNKIENYDIYNGVIDPNMYRTTTHIFADSFPADIEPFEFFSSPINVLVGEITANPLKFSVEVINREAAERDIERRSKMTAQAIVREGLDAVSQEAGHDFSFLKNKGQYMPSSPAEMQEYLSEKGDNENAVYDMMQYVMYKYNIEHELAKSFRDKAIINSEFGEVMIKNGDPVFKRLHPSCVAWLGGGDDIETLDDCDAVCSYRYISFTEFITRHGHKMQDATTFKRLQKQVQEIIQHGGDWGELRGQWQRDGTVIVDVPVFPHHYRYGGNTGVLLSEQTSYIKFVKTRRYKMTLEGKPLTEEYHNAMKRGEMWRIANLEDIQYEPLSDDYEPKASDTIKTIPYIELWTATRIGADYLLECRKSPFQNRKENNRLNITFPIKGRINAEPSMLTKGIPIYNMYMRIMFQLQRQVNLSGLKTVFVDAAQMPANWDMNEFLYTAKAVGLGVYNSQQAMATQNPNLANKHLTTVDWGLNDDIQRLLNLATLMMDLYAQVSGVALARQGYIKSQEGVGQSQQAQIQSSLITQPMSFEHSMFVRDVLQEMADIGRYLWATDESKAVIIGQYGKKVFKLNKDIKLDEYGIFVTDSYRDRKDKEFLMAMGERALSTSSINFRELIRMYYSDNPAEVENIFSEGMSKLEKIEAEMRQQQAQTEQQKVEVDAQKINVPIEVAKINADAMLRAKEMDLQYKTGHDDRSFQYKEDLQDIKSNQDAQKMEAQAGIDAAQDAAQNEHQTALELMRQYYGMATQENKAADDVGKKKK